QGAPHARRYRRCDCHAGDGDLSRARRGAGRHRRAARAEAGGLMARRIEVAQGKRLALPGRISLEPISGAIGSRVSVRIAEIAVAKPGDPRRGPHLHSGFEEVIYVLSGEGTTCAESGDIPIKPGDMVLIPAGEKHMTRNTGSVPLVLLCFFPV